MLYVLFQSANYKMIPLYRSKEGVFFRDLSKAEVFKDLDEAKKIAATIDFRVGDYNLCLKSDHYINLGISGNKIFI